MAILKTCLAALCVALAAVFSAQAQDAAAEKNPIALKGFDPVAYFVDGRAVKGSPEFQHDWDDARYQFSSAQHRSTFVADPGRYAPRFGALCATGLSSGKQIAADPAIWKIVDGRLYIFSSAKARDMAVNDPALLERARQAHRGKP